MAQNSLDVSKVVDLLGAYHRTNYSDIVSKYRENLSLKEVFPMLSTVRDELVVTESYATEVMQPYQSEWTPKGSLGFRPEILKVRYAKADITLDPNVFRATHLADFLTQAPSEEHELVRLAYQEWLKRAARDTDRSLIKGKYDAVTAGTAGNALDTCDGYLEFLKKNITAGKITPTETGAIDVDNIIDMVERMWNDIPEDMRSADLRCYMSLDLRRKYFQAYRDRFGVNNDYNGWHGCVDGTEVPIVGLPYMGSSQRIAFSVHGNMRQLCLNPADLFKFDAQKDKRLINFLMDWSLGFGAMMVGVEGGGKENQYIWCNDVDEPVTTPSQE